MTRTAHRGLSVRLVAALLAMLLVAGCTDNKSRTEPRRGEPAADEVVKALVTALTSGDLAKLPVVGEQPAARAAAQKDYAAIMAGMDGRLPTMVTAQPVQYPQKGIARVDLAQAWSFGGAKNWTYTSHAELNLVDSRWYVKWQPSIVHPQLTANTRLRHTQENPKREAIFDGDGKALMEEADLSRVGLDKANLPKEQWDSSARRLASLLKIDVDAYAKKVADAGEKAFVPAKTVRLEEVPAGVVDVPGVHEQDAVGTVTTHPGMGTDILGVTGEATAEQAKASKGLVSEGDTIGLTGLQRRYDKQLRGVPGHDVTLVPRKGATPGKDEQVDITLFTQEPVKGKPFTLTLKTERQLKAEDALRDQSGVASLVAVDIATGAVVAAANAPASKGNPDATFGRYAPGSTFKVVTSLAMLRNGMTPESRVDCPATATIGGRTFKNYTDYPTHKLGSITLREALANSCNTAFMLQASKLPKDALQSAGAALGVGVDFAAGFPVFYGSVPTTGDQVMAAANTIGQGQIEMSPLAMAGVAASVAAGKTTVPWLVKGQQPAPNAALTAAEASQLQALMKAVVTEGSARTLQGVVTGAKTGTAEFGSDTPPKTHAWMVVYTADLAIAVMVKEGQSGSGTAGPVIRRFLA